MSVIFDILGKLRIDKGDADSTFAGLQEKADKLKQSSTVPLGVDDKGAQEAINTQIRSIAEWKKQLVDLKAQRDKAEDSTTLLALNRQITTAEDEIKKLKAPVREAFDTKPVETFDSAVSHIGPALDKERSSLDSFKEKAKDSFGEGAKKVAEFATGGLLANGLQGIASEIIDKARTADNAADSLSISLARAGLSGEAAKQEIQRLGEAGAKIADDFALPEEQVTQLQAKIAGFGGVSGKQLDQLTELSIGMSNALQMPAESIAKMIAKSADPEAQASLARLGIQFDKNATVAEKLNVIQAKYGATVQATKDSTNDAIGNFDRLKNNVEKTAIGFASKAFEAVGPLFKALTPVLKVVGDVLGVLADALSPLISAIVDLLTPALQLLEPVLKAVGDFIGGYLSKVVGALTETFGGVAKAIGGIIHGDFSAITEGIGQTVKGLAKSALAPIAGATEGANRVVAGALGNTADAEKKVEGAAKSASTAMVEGANAAADAQKSLADQIAAANAEFSGQFDYNKKKIEEDNQTFLRQAEAARSGFVLVDGQQVAITDAQRKAYADANVKLEDAIRLRVQINKEHDKELEALKKRTNQTEEAKKADQDLLARAKELADTAAKNYEIDLKHQRALEGRAFSAADELAVQRVYTDELNKQVAALEVATAQKGKFAGKLKLELETNDVKTLDLTAKVKVDAQKVQKDLQAAVDDVFSKEIELGIRPKSDGLALIEQQRARVQKELDDLKFDPFDPASFNEASVRANQLTSQLLAFDKQEKDLRTAQEKELSDLRIGVMSDSLEKDLATIEARYNEETQFARDAAAAGRDLRADEVEKKKLIDEAYQRDRAAKEKEWAQKRSKDELDVVGYTKAQVLNVLGSIETSRTKLSTEELNDQRKKYADDRKALEDQLHSGKLSREKYADEVKKLERDRAKFEADNDDSLRARLGAGIESTYNQAKSAIDKEVNDFIAGQIAKQAQHLFTQLAIQAASATTTTAIVTDSAEQQAAEEAAAQKTLIGALAKLLDAWIGLGGPLGIPAFAASALVLEATFYGLASGIKALGFADGGFMGVVGERGAEIVGPAKDFSQFAAATIIETARAVERGLTERQGRRGSARADVNVRLSGRAVTSGRTMVTTLEREDYMSRKERLVPA